MRRCKAEILAVITAHDHMICQRNPHQVCQFQHTVSKHDVNFGRLKAAARMVMHYDHLRRIGEDACLKKLPRLCNALVDCPNAHSFSAEELALAKSVDLTAVAASLGYTVKKIGRYHTLTKNFFSRPSPHLALPFSAAIAVPPKSSVL